MVAAGAAVVVVAAGAAVVVVEGAEAVVVVAGAAVTGMGATVGTPGALVATKMSAPGGFAAPSGYFPFVTATFVLHIIAINFITPGVPDCILWRPVPRRSRALRENTNPINLNKYTRFG